MDDGAWLQRDPLATSFAYSEERYSNTDCAGNDCGPEDTSHRVVGQYRQCEQRPSNGASRIHGLQESESRADLLLLHRLGEHDIARRGPNALGYTVGETYDQHVPPGRGNRQYRLNDVCDHVPRNHDGLTPAEAVRQIS